MRKKQISILLAGMLAVSGVVGLTGCGSNAEATKNSMKEIYDHFTTDDDDGYKYEYLMEIADDNSYLKVVSYTDELMSLDFGAQAGEDFVTEGANCVEEAMNVVSYTNDTFDLPESLEAKIESTSAADGTQEEVYDDVTVTWSYSSYSGLEIMYEVNE